MASCPTVVFGAAIPWPRTAGDGPEGRTAGRVLAPWLGTALRCRTSPRPFDSAQDKPRAFRLAAPVVVGEAGRRPVVQLLALAIIDLPHGAWSLCKGMLSDKPVA